MFRMYASNSHSYTHLVLALGIVRKPTVWVFITSKYPGIHDIGLATDTCSWPRTTPIRVSDACLRVRVHVQEHTARECVHA